VISASANVMSRLAILVNQFDDEFTGEKRLSLLRGVAGYLKIYYRARGADGNYHTTHAIFKLVEPDKQGRFSNELLRENYRSALKIVDLLNPENSLFIRKPLGDASQEGLIGAKTTPHGGGRRWAGLNDAAVQTVLEWINGAKWRAAGK
jgi:hypothetical protein